MAARRFWDYLDGKGNNQIAAWLEQQPVAARQKIQARIRFLMTGVPLQMPFARTLTGNCKGLIEVRVSNFGVAYRLLGFKHADNDDVTLLMGAYHKGRLDPANACETALRRKQHVLQRSARTCEHDLGRSETDRLES